MYITPELPEKYVGYISAPPYEASCLSSDQDTQQDGKRKSSLSVLLLNRCPLSLFDVETPLADSTFKYQEIISQFVRIDNMYMQ